VVGPGPACGDAQGGGPGGAADLPGDLQQPVAQCLRLGQGEGPVQEQVTGPGEQVDAGQGELEPRLVDGEEPGRESAEAGGLPAADRSSTRA